MTSRGSFKLRIPPSILKRGVLWHKIILSPGSGQFPGGNARFTGAQWPSVLIPCMDGTCQSIEFDIPAELIRVDDYVRDATAGKGGK